MNTFALVFVICYLAVANAAITQHRQMYSYQQQNKLNTNILAKKSPTKFISTSIGKEDKILRNDIEMKKDGTYHYQYETSNGISGNEHGVGGVSVQGTSSYISPEGVEIKTTYIADENGYHPVGDHIPKTPDYILRALEYIRTHPYKDNEDTKKSYNTEFPKKVVVAAHVVPPTHKPISRKVTPTAKRFVKVVTKNNKFSSKHF